MDDIWEDSSPNYETELRNREWNVLHRQYTANGYREALEQGKETTLQMGFDNGFRIGSKKGLYIGKIVGVVSGLNLIMDKLPCSKLFSNKISTFSSQVDEIQQKRNLLLQQMKPVDENLNTEIINLFCTFVKELLENCVLALKTSQSKKSASKEDIYSSFDVEVSLKIVQDLLKIRPLTTEEPLAEILFMDIFPHTSVLALRSTTQTMQDTSIQILQQMITMCNPREALLAIMDIIHEYLQELKYDYLVSDNNIDLFKRAFVIQFLIGNIPQVISKLAQNRIAAALEQCVASLSALLSDSEAKQIDSLDETSYGSSDFSVDIKNSNLSEEDFQLRENINQFVPSVLQVAKAFCQVIPTAKFYTEYQKENDDSKKQHMALALLFRLLQSLAECKPNSKVALPESQNSDNQNTSAFLSRDDLIQEIISLISTVCQQHDGAFALEYATKLNDKKQHLLEDYEENSVPDELLRDLVPETAMLSSKGLGFYLCILYNAFSIDQEAPPQLDYSSKIPSILSGSYQLKLVIPYLIELLKYPKTSQIGLNLAYRVLSPISAHTVRCHTDNEPLADSIYHSLAQSLINFMVNCPKQSLRNLGLKILNLFITTLEDTSRLEFLKLIITTCPYHTVTAFMIVRLKDEVERKWNEASNTNNFNSPFLTHVILDIVNRVSTTSEILNRVEVVMSILNFYRFLLIRDKKTNITGIWNPSKLQDIKSSFLEPLKKEISSILDHKPSEQDKEHTMQMAKQFGLPEMNQEELNRVHSANNTTLLLMQDTLLRVLEVMQGAPPVSGTDNAVLSQQ